MAPPSTEWPVLATSRENSATKHDRVMNMFYDAKRLAEVIGLRPDHRIPKVLQEFTRNVQTIADDLLKDPLDQGWVHTTTNLQAGISNIQKDIAILKNAPQTASARVQTYADATRGAPPPAHYRSSHDSGSSRGATPSDLDQDREVIIKLSAQSTQQYRKYKSPEILKKANRAFRGACMIANNSYCSVSVARTMATPSSTAGNPPPAPTAGRNIPPRTVNIRTTPSELTARSAGVNTLHLTVGARTGASA